MHLLLSLHLLIQLQATNSAGVPCLQTSQRTSSGLAIRFVSHEVIMLSWHDFLLLVCSHPPYDVVHTQVFHVRFLVWVQVVCCAADDHFR